MIKLAAMEEEMTQFFFLSCDSMRESNKTEGREIWCRLRV